MLVKAMQEALRHKDQLFAWQGVDRQVDASVDSSEPRTWANRVGTLVGHRRPLDASRLAVSTTTVGGRACLITSREVAEVVADASRDALPLLGEWTG